MQISFESDLACDGEYDEWLDYLDGQSANLKGIDYNEEMPAAWKLGWRHEYERGERPSELLQAQWDNVRGFS